METIEIDNDVFAYLQEHARPFVDTPNSTLRRLLAIDTVGAASGQRTSTPGANPGLDEILAENLAAVAQRSKAPKARIQPLVQRGLLRNGQRLYLIDYKRNRVQKCSAVIAGGDLIYNNQRYAMSNLAQELLSSHLGLTSKSVRGPAHWETDEGKSIQDLWQQHLSGTEK